MKTLKKEDMAELIGQFVDIVEDFLGHQPGNDPNEIHVLKKQDYNSLASGFKEILGNWDLVEEAEEYTQEEKEDLEEWNTPTD